MFPAIYTLGKMNTYPTIEGAFYVVTATTETQVTDEHGLALTVAAGKQESFLATGESVSYDGQCHFQQVRNFRVPPGGDAGGPFLPVPESLPEGALKNGHVYLSESTATAPLDLRGVEVEARATVELWVDYHGGSVHLPPAWIWVDDDEPDNWTAGTRYCIVCRNDGRASLANCCYQFELPSVA